MLTQNKAVAIYFILALIYFVLFYMCGWLNGLLEQRRNGICRTLNAASSVTARNYRTHDLDK